MNKDFLKWLIFGDKRQTAMFAFAAVMDYLMLTLCL